MVMPPTNCWACDADGPNTELADDNAPTTLDCGERCTACPAFEPLLIFWKSSTALLAYSDCSCDNLGSTEFNGFTFLFQQYSAVWPTLPQFEQAGLFLPLPPSFE